jgi:hypothetical protein
LVAGEPAVAVNVAVEVLAGTVTDAGTLSIALFEDNATVAPPANAGNASVTVQVELPPDNTLAGEHVRLDTAIPVMLSDAVAVVPFSEAVTIAA